jgi:hypothetical protein
LVHLEIVLVSVRDSARFALNVPQTQKLFWMHAVELLGDLGHVESRFSLFG